MHHRLVRLHVLALTGRQFWSEELLALIIAFLVVIPASADVVRLQERSLFMQNTEPSATTSYTLSFGYNTPAVTGSIDILACLDPIPYMPCDPPPGLDLSGAVLSEQAGETGYTITTQTTNHIVLSRIPTMTTTNGSMSSYKFDGVVNPSITDPAFALRLRTHGTTDATGPQIDVGSVRGQATNSIQIETQVPPQLVFCLAGQVELYCLNTNSNYYTDMGELSPDSTLTAQSQMAVGTNATAGFAITIDGTPPAAGTNVIDAPTAPTVSTKGVNQFGINLVANNDPAVGGDPEGPFANAVPSADYSQPNMYKYIPGDTIAFSPNVSLMRKFTVSYILNSSADLKAGVYTTTLTFIASGRF